MEFDLAIVNGTIVTAERVYQSNIAINQEKIVAIGEDVTGKRIIDASNKLILPGGVDPHVHFDMRLGDTRTSDDWRSGTIAAACGGTTTVIDFVEPELGQTLESALLKRQSVANEAAVIDYGLHMTLRQSNQETLSQISEIISFGCPSFKTYLVYEDFCLTDSEFLTVLAAVKDAGGLTMVHAENASIVDYMRTRLLSAGCIDPEFHPFSRPDISEGEAIQRALALAEITQAPIYIVHVSTAIGLEAILRSRRRGVAVDYETCIQYLILSDDLYSSPGLEPANYICSPPLRSAENKRRLLEALESGDVNIVSTDHCSFNFQGQRDQIKEDFTSIPGGLPGVESRLSLLYTFGVREGLISLPRWVDVCSTKAAKTFGLYPRKGTIAINADADLVIFDPDQQKTLSADWLHERVDYTPYEGIKLYGYPTLTMQRGKVLFNEGEYVGPDKGGQFLLRKL